MTHRLPLPPLSLELLSAPPRREPGTLEIWQAVALALLLHLLGGLALWLTPPAGTASGAALESRARLKSRPPKPQPMKFRFVDIPDQPEAHNPRAREASDRSRTARGAPRPVHAPAPDNPDPYALGTTSQAVLTGPSRSGPAGAPLPPSAPDPAPGSPSPPSPRAGPAPAGKGGAAPRAGEGTAAAPVRPQAAAGGLLAALPRVSESDLLESFHNPGGASPMDIGTVSFDTAAIDWGPYARRMLQVIRRTWIDRLPPAALSGLRGVAVVNFRIARDGSVSSVALVDSYGVRPNARGGAEVTDGVRPFETTAMAAIEGSDLPPLPDIFEEPDVGVTIAFYYNLRPPR